MTNELDLLKNEVDGHEYRTVGFNKDCSYAGHLPSLLGSVNCWRAEANKWLRENEIKIEVVNQENLDRIAIKAGVPRATLMARFMDAEEYSSCVVVRYSRGFIQYQTMDRHLLEEPAFLTLINDHREWEGI